jgi:hypothetical protein
MLTFFSDVSLFLYMGYINSLTIKHNEIKKKLKISLTIFEFMEKQLDMFLKQPVDKKPTNEVEWRERNDTLLQLNKLVVKEYEILIHYYDLEKEACQEYTTAVNHLRQLMGG